MDFFDRVDESDRLKRFLALKEGALACLYGRRRIGKSRLLEEILTGRTDVTLHQADRSEAPLQRARLAKDLSSLLPGFGDVTYSDWGTLFDRWRRNAPTGSVLVLDELPYLVERAPELPSVLQRVADGLRTSGQKLIVCGSSQTMMQGLLLRPDEPLYGRARELVDLGPISFEWTKCAFPSLSLWERFEHYAVWGGVPRYWEVCQGETSLWETLRRQVFSPQGLFRDEPDFVLHEDLKDAVQATSVLSVVGQGAARPSEIAARLQVPMTSLGRPLRRLMELGLVCRDIPFGCDEKSNKRTLYRVTDPFLRFWYSFALPNYSDPYYLSSPEEAEAIRGPFRVFLGQAWESLVRETLRRRAIPGVSGRWRKVARWWGNGLDRRPMELDVVAESLDGRTLLVGEAKLSLSPREAERALAELKGKAANLPFAKAYAKTVIRLFVADGDVPNAISLAWLDGGIKP